MEFAMHRTLRTALLAVAVALAGSATVASTASAQGECSLITTDEVIATLGVSDVTSQGSGAFCSFSGGTTLYVAVTPGTTLDSVKADTPDGADVTVGGHAGWYSTGPGLAELAVDVGGQLLALAWYIDDVTGAQAPLVALAELAVPRVPAGPDPALVERLTALIPATLGGEPLEVQSFGGDLIVGFLEETAPDVIALREALATQGKTPSDLLLVGGETEGDTDWAFVMIHVNGGDATQLVVPLLTAFMDDSEEALQTQVQLGGKQVTRIEQPESVRHAYASGDTLFLVAAPDDELEGIFATLP
jgi:hypothetical protein